MIQVGAIKVALVFCAFFPWSNLNFTTCKAHNIGIKGISDRELCLVLDN